MSQTSMALKPTLRLWSQGPTVRDLQASLNQVLPFAAPSLKTDGIYGPKTFARVKEFQTLGNLSVDGIAGPQTWGFLAAVLSGAIALATQAAANLGFPVPEENPLRNAIAKVAHQEFLNHGAHVHAVLGGGIDPVNHRTYRKGYQRLLEYFRLAAPSTKPPDTTLFHDDAVIYLSAPGKLAPMPNWCGIFALWAIKTALPAGPIGTWKNGQWHRQSPGIRPHQDPEARRCCRQRATAAASRRGPHGLPRWRRCGSRHHDRWKQPPDKHNYAER